MTIDECGHEQTRSRIEQQTIERWNEFVDLHTNQGDIKRDGLEGCFVATILQECMYDLATCNEY